MWIKTGYRHWTYFNEELWRKYMEDIKLNKISYIFGDDKFRVLYGPENGHGERDMIGLIRKDYVERIGDILDLADTNTSPNIT